MAILGRVGRKIGRFGVGGMAASAMGAGMAAGPIGMAGLGALRFGRRAIADAPRAYNATRRGIESATTRTTARTAGSSNAAVRWAGRHPFATAAIATGPGYGFASGYASTTNGNRVSRRNQNDPYLRKVRAAQQARSSATMGLPGHSMGGMTGYW